MDEISTFLEFVIEIIFGDLILWNELLGDNRRHVMDDLMFKARKKSTTCKNILWNQMELSFEIRIMITNSKKRIEFSLVCWKRISLWKVYECICILNITRSIFYICTILSILVIFIYKVSLFRIIVDPYWTVMIISIVKQFLGAYSDAWFKNWGNSFLL